MIVLYGPGIFSVNWAVEHVSGIIQAWMPGPFAGEVVANVLDGTANPGGKLNVTVPRSAGQIPIFYNHKNGSGYASGSDATSATIFSGGYTDGPGTPLYPFGYGLSYTEFKVENLKIGEKEVPTDGKIEVSCSVSNTGKAAGDEVVQLYQSFHVDTFLTEKRLSGISPETYNHYHSGIRFFYKKVLKMNWDDDDIPRMKRDRSLPTVLTKAEISAILYTTPNLKHKAMIATMYSGGLRVSEVTHLHYDDISRTNKTIHIRDGKSRFDRYTLLADRTLEILTEYWFKCGRPTGILFPSSWTGDYLVKDSVIQFFRKSAKRAGIQKHVSTHCLRHSFASHLFEAGCDVKYIQALLGHRDPRSTEIYLHVSNKTLLGIRSPFDEMGGE